ncbi:putative PAS/PAC sensor protein [Arcobacter nitrofigilis DSM 7299]|uniref:Putative PAS/PAC sensor protein n=1 Tax=Arcobacter nitrofigilis (strain ATCC 33309 / DSM 7299 / CCUG 15893 / LMG 7604 / NCTC 12251 / CI) TaxID=572480 RepID=D5V232_ARCNC|nr:response regulator [Arcobacter nitrofigilis]ADG92265.1 putative PAS/PAC sensor protein [Arcobacter nitrofigilis DSM 7299]
MDDDEDWLSEQKYNIIYVEDDEQVRINFQEIFQDFFKEVYVASDGVEALEVFNKLTLENKRIDAIISDLNMPNMNGIALLKNIRAVNEDIPFYFTTAYSDENNLLEVIRLNVTAYFIKPIDISVMVKKVIKDAHKYNQNQIIEKQKDELERYLAAIDNVAIISKTDLKGNITFANDFFCDISKYKREELLGKPHNIVRHPDSSKEIFRNLWETIQKGETWNGKIKNLAKDGSIYYVNSTVIPIFDELGSEIVEYVGIRFLTTEEENSKREFRKKVIENMQQSKKKEIEYINQIRELQREIKSNTKPDLSMYLDQMDNMKRKNGQLKAQINQYDKEIIAIRKKNEELIDSANNKVSKSVFALRKIKSENDKLVKDFKELENEIELKKDVILDLQKRLEERNKRIEDLLDVISLRDKELKEQSK